MLSLVTRPALRRTRRHFLRVGALGAFGLSLPGFLRAREQVPPPATDGSSFGRARRCLMVYLSGGPSQLDLWDLKPDAAAEVRGELKPIATSVPGIQITELMPRLARQVDKFRIVRSLTHGDTEHTTSFSTMLTGTYHPRPGIVQPAALPSDHPHLGSILARWRSAQADIPQFVSLPTLFQPPGNGIWPGQTAGFLGRRYDPFVVHGDKATARFRPPDLELPLGESIGRLQQRRQLVDSFDKVFATAEAQRDFGEVDLFYRQAFEMVTSPRMRAAFSLDQEGETVHESYGRHLFGQGLLLARRLCEIGIPMITVYWIDPAPPGLGGGEFDSHGRIYPHLRDRLLPPTDQALAALFEDLAQRRLLDDTLVVVLGEFGRTPRINSAAGRDHWPAVQSILMAGAGIPGGSVFGSSDRLGAYPASNPLSPPDLAQTVLHALGVPAEFELHDQQGRPIAACRGKVVGELLG